MRISDWSSDVCSSDLPQLYALSHVVAVAPDTSSVYGTTPIAQYHGLHASDFITTPATIAGASAASDAGSYTDRKSVVSGKSVSVRVDLGGRRIIKKKTDNIND